MSTSNIIRHLTRLGLVTLCWGALAVTTQADIVTVSTSQASGSSWVPSGNDFFGRLDQGSPATIGGTNLNFNGPIPGGESFQAGDIVGRDIDELNSVAVWSYNLFLPSNAMSGTGFQDIVFDAHAFERGVGNLDSGDRLAWAMYLNGGSTAVATGGVNDDFTTFDLSLLNAGGDSINQVSVVFGISGFTDSNDWFASRGLLSANYVSAIPEADFSRVMIAALLGAFVRRERRS